MGKVENSTTYLKKLQSNLLFLSSIADTMPNKTSNISFKESFIQSTNVLNNSSTNGSDTPTTTN